MNTYTVAVRDYPHTTPLKAGAHTVEACRLEFPEYDPIYKAFAPMVRELRFDVCEMAIATYLQAREAGKAISLLPLVMSGNLHHHSLTRFSGAPAVDPRELAGARIGVRAYTQTTGLWVRGALSEDYGVHADEVTWVTTEGPHVLEYQEPANVQRSDKSLIEMARDGDVAAVIRGPIALEGDGGALVPVIEDWRAAEAAWQERHDGATPINHMVTVRTELLQSDPESVRAIYDAFCWGIDNAGEDTTEAARYRAVAHGLTDEVRASLQAAVAYALEQRLITEPVNIDDLVSDFERHVVA